MTEEIQFPQEVIIDNAGIGYLESGPFKVYLNLVVNKPNEIDVDLLTDLMAKGNVQFISSIDTNEVNNAFTCLMFGRVLYSVTLTEVMEGNKKARENMEK